MSMVAEEKYKHVGETKACEDHDHDLVQELSKRLKTVWRMDQYMANAEDKPEIRGFWDDLKQQELNNIGRLKGLIANEVQTGCF